MKQKYYKVKKGLYPNLRGGGGGAKKKKNSPLLWG